MHSGLFGAQRKGLTRSTTVFPSLHVKDYVINFVAHYKLQLEDAFRVKTVNY